jgi:mannan endo-1,4-beta-mannosidase
MTRAGMAILIAKALKIEPQKGNNAAKAFTDIQGLDEATQLILAALRDAGISEGYPDGSFKPDSPLTRAEMAVLIERILAHFQK